MAVSHPVASTHGDPDRLLTAVEAAALLGMSPGTLEVWRSTRRYPLPFVRIGNRVRYRHRDVVAFIAGRRVVAPDADA